MNEGETLKFTLQNGQTRKLTVLSTDARIVLSNLDTPKEGKWNGETIYAMTARVRVDGAEMTMERFIPVQQSFYDPYVINGMRIWFDGVRDVQSFLNDNHGGGVPEKDLRIAVQDMTLSAAPEPMHPWYPNPDNYIDVGDSYNANDVWMGPYQGADLHAGLDVNMPIGTPLWAPIDFDDQFYFESLEQGHNNNRWRGIRTWSNGERWVLQAHHIVRLKVDQHTPIKQGTDYAETAGVLPGSHAHSHFVFQVGPPDNETKLDPWILFRAIFERNRSESKMIKARMQPLDPATTGTPVSFSSEGSRAGPTGNELSYRWTFGDGATSTKKHPEHTYVKPGLYPVTLVVDDGTERDQFTQHLTVTGSPKTEKPALALSSPASETFRRRPVEVMDVYGHKPQHEPFTLRFLARPRTMQKPEPKRIFLENIGGGGLADPETEISYHAGREWLSVSTRENWITVQPDATGMKARRGRYRATVTIDTPGALNTPQSIDVRLDVPPRSLEKPARTEHPPETVIVDNEDDGFYHTPWYWLTQKFYRHFQEWRSGYNGSYFIYGGKASREGEYVRFRPDLQPGTYSVSFVEETPFIPCKSCFQKFEDPKFRVRIRHANGVETGWVSPKESRRIGTFEFHGGRSGYVDILPAQSEGIVVADALRFEKK